MIVLAALLVCAATLLLPAVQCVSISNRKNPSERVLSRSALSGFCISYTHSVNKGRIRDVYECDGNEIVLVQTHFVSYGAGISEASETDGAFFEVEEDGYAIKNLDRRLKKMVMAVGVIAEHSISVGNREVFLKSLFKEQTSLVFEIKRVSLLGYIFSNHI